jgi:uncharacterized protein (DUF2141 family)
MSGFDPGFRVALCAVALASLGSAGTVRAVEPAPSPALEFRTAVRGSEGVVRCGLFTQSGWLKLPVRAAVSAIRGGFAQCTFKGVPRGVYGISAFHDKNNNGKLDTNFIGLPTEDYCASRNARGTFGPPSFDDAKFNYDGGVKHLNAQMK